MSLRFSNFPLIKVSATGNDFIVADLLSPNNASLWHSEWAQENRTDLARRWCDRHEGLGADGFVVLENSVTADFAWDFYNSDGGSAEMCGNAARAVSLLVYLTQAKEQFAFVTKAGVVHAQILNSETIEVRLPEVAEFSADHDFDFVRAGVPHAVVRVNTLDDRQNLRERAQQIKSLARFALAGVNVTFLVAKAQADAIASITYERGVEDFTLSCGTGAIAAAYSFARGTENRPIEVEVPGGRLSVLWKQGRPHLRGPAKIVARLQVRRRLA